MSGVAAVFARDGASVDPSDLNTILRCQAHRGPDGLRVWWGGSVGFGHAALDIGRQSFAVQPLVMDGGRLAVVGDLRIDNRRELTGLLDLQGETTSDAGVVLEAYRRWGIDAPRRLAGAFSFVIWDGARQRIFCARDHLGVKPLAYHLSRELFVCASEAEAVAGAPGVPHRINETRIADFLVSQLEGVDHTSTFFEGVLRLPPAHLLVVEREGHRLRRYWQPDTETELLLESDDAYAEVFWETFRQTVDSCLTDVISPGLLLSGGIDSAAIGGAAGSPVENGDAARLTSYSAIDEENDPSPETANILATIDHLGITSRTISPASVAGLAPSVRRSFFECGEPFDSSMVVASLLYSMAAGAGSRMVLDGVDGDVVVSNPVPTVHLLRRGQLLRAWRETVARRRLFPSSSHPLRALVGGAFGAWAPIRVRRVVQKLRSRRDVIGDAIRESLIDGDFARRIHLDDRLAQLWGRHRQNPAADPRDVHAGVVAHPYIASALERYDRVAARRGIEARHPFLDLRLVTLCLSLPWDLKVRWGWTKFILRLATEGKVLDAVRWRHDDGDVLWRPTSRVIAEEQNFLRSILHDHKDELGPFVDLGKLDRVRRVLGGNLTDQEEVWIWEAVSLAKWLVRNHS